MITYTNISKSSLALPEPIFTISGGVVTNTCANAQTATVIIANCDDNAAMLDVSSETITLAAGETIDYDLVEIKLIFIWNSLDGMYPLYKAKMST